MRFSYTLLKNLVPKLPDRTKFIEKFNLHAFESEAVGEDALEISIPANRYADASFHLGIARLAAAIFNSAIKEPKTKEPKIDLKNTKPEIKISSKKQCSRYLGRYFEVPGMNQSPKWMKDALIICGLRSINAVVDVLNYVMLETGQPLHAFDADLVSGPIDIRFAKAGEEIRTLEGADYKLSLLDLVIADEKGPLAIAGIKGGKRAEINLHTKKIIVEAANFDSIGIYKTSRQLSLFTDASARFSHGISPVSAEVGMKRATALLKEIVGAKVGELTDVNYAKFPKVVLKFDIQRFNRLTGFDLSRSVRDPAYNNSSKSVAGKESVALDCLKKLGFLVKGKYVEVPPLRADISTMEDLTEEIVNLYGYEKLPAEAPHIPLAPAQKEDQILLKEKIREILRGFGMSEIYNYSFVSRKDLMKYADPKWWGAAALLNPISADFHYLRPGLSVHLLRNIEDNLRFYDAVRIFEIGKVFVEKKEGLEESTTLGMALALSSRGGSAFGGKKDASILELKGLAEQLLQALGLVEYFFRDLDWDLKFLDQGKSLRIESDHQVIGYIGIPKAGENIALAEICLDKLLKLVEEEKEYEPLSKYPSIMRDVSLFVPRSVRVNEILEAMENSAPQFMDDVDLIDFYEDPNQKEDRKSLTFRLVFQAEDRTLTDEEVGAEMVKVVNILEEKFDAEIR